MTFLEKTADPRRLRHWEGNVEADYIYTAGIGGERFLRALKDDGVLLTAKCEHCGIQFLPLRIYCERCLNPVQEWGEAPATALVEAATVTRRDEFDRPLAEPQVWGLLRWEGVEGGLVHRLLVDVSRVRPGMKVRMALRPAAERAGEITDILGFSPV